jgi:uncharacterized protein (TIGR02996 family)
MTERDALLKAVCDHPGDDIPRLVFADWLQEHGEDKRADFIRLQIQFDRGTFQPSEEAELKNRLQKLSARKAAWELEIPRAVQIGFSRGFIERACLLSGDDVGRALVSAPIRSLSIRAPVDLIAVMRVPLVARLELLSLNDAQVRRADVEEFLRHDWPKHPGRLELTFDVAGDDLHERVWAKFGEWVCISHWLGGVDRIAARLLGMD